MPVKGFTNITVSEDLKAELKAKADALGMNLPTLIERYTLKFPEAVQGARTDSYGFHDAVTYGEMLTNYNLENRMSELCIVIKDRLFSNWHKVRAKELRKAGEPLTEASIDEQNSKDAEFNVMAYDIAKVILEKEAKDAEIFDAMLKERNSRSKATLHRAKILEDLNAMQDHLSQFPDGVMSISDFASMSDLLKRLEFWKDAIPYSVPEIQALYQSVESKLDGLSIKPKGQGS